jgi:four helix bundle protein
MEKPHKKLDVWNAALELVLATYRLSESFPGGERFCLTEQIRRASLSIPSNIAEGAARQTKKEFIHYLHIAQGSLSELDTQLELAKRLQYLTDGDWASLDGQMLRVDKMLSGLIRHLKTSRR